MKATHQAYARAREQHLAAQRDLVAAEELLREAEAAVQVDLEAAWEANRRAVEAADARFAEARDHRRTVEDEVGAAARARYTKAGGVGLVMTTEAEHQQVDAARTAEDEARQAAIDAREAFKAGVTIEQLLAAAKD